MTDTTPAAALVQLRILRGLAPEARLRLALEMSTTARALLRSRLRDQHPEWSAPAIAREMARCALATAEPPPR